jgi:hypothetical protein
MTGRFRFAVIVGFFWVAVLATAQDSLPERKLPSANGRRKPIKVQRIYGIVMDVNDAVIPNVQVELRRKQSGKVLEIEKIATDHAGRFDLVASRGKYDVVFRANGFSDQIVPVQVSTKGWPGFKLTLVVSGFIDPIKVPLLR